MEEKKKILVVDDEEALCDGLGFNLEAEGYHVDTAYSAEEALARDLAGYDLILLDIMMGEISGIQLARIMKSNPYADLRIDNRADLPAPWYDYPVLQSGEYRTEILYTNGRDYVKVHIGQQDGVWVAATTWMIGGSSRGCHPGRKWGEFASEQNALLWAFGELLAEEGVLPPAAIKTVKARIFEIRQYKLF